MNLITLSLAHQITTTNTNTNTNNMNQEKLKNVFFINSEIK
jgi:hypothetical protein